MYIIPTSTKTNSIPQDRLTPPSAIRDFSPNPSSREQTSSEFSEDRLPRYAVPRTFITKVHLDQRADARVAGMRVLGEYERVDLFHFRMRASRKQAKVDTLFR